MDKFNETDLQVLGAVLKWHTDGNGNSLSDGVKIEYIQELVKKSVSRIRNSLNLLIEHGYISEGFKQGLKKTYVIQPLGVAFLANAKKSVIDINNDMNQNGGV